MLRLRFDAGNDEDARHFLVLYVSLGNGGGGQARSVDIQHRECSVLQKLRAISTRDPNAPATLPWDVLEPRVLTTGDLLLEPPERDLCLAYVKDARWPAHLSEVRLAVQQRLESAVRVDAAT